MPDYTAAQREYLASVEGAAHQSAVAIIGRLEAYLNEAMEVTGVAGVDAPLSLVEVIRSLRAERDALKGEVARWKDIMAEEAATTMELVEALGGTEEELHQPGLTSMAWLLARIAALRQAESALAAANALGKRLAQFLQEFAVKGVVRSGMEDTLQAIEVARAMGWLGGGE